jgi:hypothetical protein
VLRKRKRERAGLQQDPIFAPKRCRNLGMHGAQARGSSAPRKKPRLMVATHHIRTGSPSDRKYPDRIRPTRDQITDEDQVVARSKRDAIKQRLELITAAMHVTHNDRALRMYGIGWHSLLKYSCRDRLQPDPKA